VNAKTIWQAVLGELQLDMTKANYETFLKHSVLVEVEGDVYRIGVANTFVKECIEERYRQRINSTLSRIVGRAVEIQVQVHQRPSRPAPLTTPAPAKTEPRPRAGARQQAEPEAEAEAQDTPLVPSKPVADGTVLNPRYTFDTFIVGKSNQLAHAAAAAVAERPGRAYNPLFIYGAVGLGKTHLLHAIGHRARAKGLEVIYVSSERFTNDLITSIRDRRTDDFRQRYRAADVLLIDDIQFIAGKESTQEEFFHTFNALHEASRQIVLCSDRPPKSIATLEERLRSRFEWGLIADVQAPEYEHRVAILREKAREQGLRDVPPDVLEYIARAAQGSIRELEGALNRVLAMADVWGRALNSDLARAALSDLAAPAERRYITAAAVLEAVARHFAVDLRALKGKQRDKEIVVPRQVAMYLMRKETEASLVEIGRELGGRDHSTVLHGCERVEQEMEVDSRLRGEIAEITQTIYNQSRK
jgi:chromosomal replication initiator protein